MNKFVLSIWLRPCMALLLLDKSKKMELYYFPTSPPCLSVLLLIRELELSPELKIVDIMNGEHLQPEYKELSVQHTVPCLNDDGFVLTESRAILLYLIEAYGQETSLYPQDVKAKALVHQMLLFDLSTIYQRVLDYYIIPAFFANTPLDESKLKRLEDGMEVLEKMLENREWAAGNERTVADFALFATVAIAQAFGFPTENYPKIDEWLNRAKESMQGYEELMKPSLETLSELFQNKMQELDG